MEETFYLVRFHRGHVSSNILNHPEYQKRYVESASREAQKLANLQVSCLLGHDRDTSRDLANVTYAQILEAFSRNALFNSQARKRTDSEEVRAKRLSEADRTAQFGLEVIHVVAEKARDRHSMPFNRRIEPSDAVEAEEQLTATQKAIQKALSDLNP